ncbi:MAG: prepilin-type N-terminal cleavage/methylation domain-containing protein [Thermosynechococcaceae cyanobacterium MS004]|nr:prepilin-type N-terminal cleavage/methylation domain-containing protein [Thermosynechococcaceae cyanobacterium MS004]
MKEKIISRSSQGFTLIETLIAVVVVGVIAAVAAPSLSAWLTNTKIKDTAIKIEGALKEAQSSAVKKGRSCTVMITAQKVSAVKFDAVTGVASPDRECMPTGERDFADQANVVGLVGTGGGSGTTVTFSLRGTTPITQDTGAVLVRRTDSDSNQVIKCLVVSSGIGIIRTGTYADSTVPSIVDLPAEPVPADPNNMTAAEVTAQNNWKAQKDIRDTQVLAVVDKCISPL